jgi:enoyl-CoA hydratase
LVQVSSAVDGVATVTLNRPEKKNALSIALRDEMSDALDALAVDDRVRAVILTGAGSVFSAGFDLSEFADPDPEHQRRLWASSDRYHHTVLCFPLPLVAAVNGAALAGGFDLAVMCDLRVASHSAFFAHVEHTFGDVVYRPLRELVGASVARDLVLTGRRIEAGEALAVGLVNRVVAIDDLLDAATAVAAEIALAPREVLIRTKAKIIAAAGIDPASRTLDL